MNNMAKQLDVHTGGTFGIKTPTSRHNLNMKQLMHHKSKSFNQNNSQAPTATSTVDMNKFTKNQIEMREKMNSNSRLD